MAKLPPIPPFALQRQTQYLIDLLVLSLAFPLAYLLRFDFNIPTGNLHYGLTQLPMVVLLQLATLHALGIYHFVWKYIGLQELQTFVKASILPALPVLVLRVGLPSQLQSWRVPLSVIVIDTILVFGGLLSVRILRRMLYERTERDHRARAHQEGRRKRVILVGAGRAGVLAVREIQSRGDMALDVMGFVDDDPLKQGMVIQGVKVLGPTRELPSFARSLEIDHAVLTIADAEPITLQRIVEICDRARIRVRTIPGLYEILQGKVSISRFRDVEVEDLLGRAPVRLDDSHVEEVFGGRSILVTGAGGTIGSELARQIARFQPSRLLLLERAENALFSIHRELKALWPDLTLEPLVADIGDETRVASILAEGRPQVVLHAAAHKHVPMMEANPGEAVKNNSLATEVLGRLAGQHGVERFVLISTDKAVRPTSVMGATKRLAELVIQDLNRLYPTRYLAVRFGNVLGSAGSVIPIFREQIARGGPVTVTHPEMIRFFMTVPEAAQLVLEAGAMGEGGEIFVLDMGEPMKILDLAREMIRLSGLEPGRDIEIAFTGIRPGEKLFEELEMGGEGLSKTRHPKIFIGQLAAYPPETVRRGLVELRAEALRGDPESIRETLGRLLPESRLQASAAASAARPVPAPRPS